MANQQIPQALYNLVETMTHPDQPPTVAQLLKNTLGGTSPNEVMQWLDSHRTPTGPLVVFVYEMPGYILVGQGGDVRPRPDPNLDGLRIANEVFLHGTNAPAVLRASDWGLTPNAMRNALVRAAEWAERYAPLLAVAVRAIKVSKEGRPTFEPNHPIRLNVF
jgi:hypothetical protein